MLNVYCNRPLTHEIKKIKLKSDCEQIAKDGCYRESCAFVLNLHRETDKIVV